MLGVLYQRPSIARPRADRWTRRVDGASLGVFRIVFGLVGLLSVVRLIDRGWATTRYAGPTHRFTYLGFGWVPKPSPAGMLVLLAVVGVAAALVAVGWHYRPAIATFFLGFTWIELIDVTTYLNHYVFVSLMAFLLCFLPADASLSISARRSGERTVAVGVLWLLRAQVGVVYVFAGIAKLHGDWLVHALPLRLWLPALDGLGPFDGLLEQRWTAHALALAGAVFDCTIVVLLLWRRTRLFAFVAVVVFHVVTWRLFPIGVFPWLMVAGATLFFTPGWPRRQGWGRWLPSPRPTRPTPSPTTPGALGPSHGHNGWRWWPDWPGWCSRWSSLSVTCCTPAMPAGRTRGTASPGTSWPSSGPATSRSVSPIPSPGRRGRTTPVPSTRPISGG